jgi:hypothetical protein
LRSIGIPNAITFPWENKSLRAAHIDDVGVLSFLRFELTNVSGTIKSAVLRLFVTEATTDGPAVYKGPIPLRT